MPREKFQILTEQMFYILLCLREECCGTDIMEKVREMTKGRVMIGPGTLYNLLESFEKWEQSGKPGQRAGNGIISLPTRVRRCSKKNISGCKSRCRIMSNSCGRRKEYEGKTPDGRIQLLRL